MHPQKTLPNRVETLPRTEELAAVSNRRKAGTEKGGQEQQNRLKNRKLMQAVSRMLV
jgi:hypothetical protein